MPSFTTTGGAPVGSTLDRNRYMARPQFEVSRVQGAPTEHAELLADLKRVAAAVGTNEVTQRLYAEHGKFASTTIARRFGTWNQALVAAGLSVSNELNISDERLPALSQYEEDNLLEQYDGFFAPLKHYTKCRSTSKC